MLRRFLAIFAALACTLLFTVSAHAQDATLAQAKALIDAKKAQEAFALLDPLEEARAGDPDFDYLLGIAAIDSGHLTRGVFALERSIAVRPNFPEARAEIARAYFLMGENRAAREEFEAVKASSPPPAVVTRVNQFLDALQARESVRDASGLSAYLEASYGYDTNANGATSAGNFAIPALAGTVVTLNATGQQTHAWFYGVGGGIAGRYKMTPEWTLLGSASLTERYVIKFDQFDLASASGDVGLSWKRDRIELLGLAQTQQTRVDDNAFRRANGGTAQVRYTLAADSEATLYYQHTRLTYPGQQTRDAVRDVVGTGYAKSFANTWLTPTVFAGFYMGGEKENHADFPQNGQNVYGFRLGGQAVVTQNFVLFANGSYEDRQYHGPDPLFLYNRHDKQSDIRVGANWVFGRNWTMTPSIAWTDNRSNIIVDDFTRWITMVNLRYDFR